MKKLIGFLQKFSWAMALFLSPIILIFFFSFNMWHNSASIFWWFSLWSLGLALGVFWAVQLRSGNFFTLFKRGIKASLIYGIIISLGAYFFFTCFAPLSLEDAILNRMDQIRHADFFKQESLENQTLILDRMQENLNLFFGKSMILSLIMLLHIFMGSLYSLISASIVKNFFHQKFGN